jgi:hypothetical protein
MAKKRGNPNWGKPEFNTIPYTGATSFEEIAKKPCLPPQGEVEERGKEERWPVSVP